MKGRAKSLIKQTYSCKESRGTMVTDRKEAINMGRLAIQRHRRQLEKYTQKNPVFLYSLEPVQVSKGPIVVGRMAEASEEAGVGPMAAVAGVLADLAVEAMIQSGAEVAVVENGGEARAASNVPIDVALQAGNSLLSRKIGFRLEHFPVGLATSSGKFSHALSFGEAEAVTVFAQNAGLADAAATAVGNVVKGRDPTEAIRRGTSRAMSITGVEGVFILFEENVGRAGKTPRIVGIKGT